MPIGVYGLEPQNQTRYHVLRTSIHPDSQAFGPNHTTGFSGFPGHRRQILELIGPHSHMRANYYHKMPHIHIYVYPIGSVLHIYYRLSLIMTVISVRIG